MNTRKIKLSQKLTLSFRDTSVSHADSVAELMYETDQGSSDETFDNLPDLLPELFQSPTKFSAPDLANLISDCSTYKLWESCTTDVIPLVSQNEVEDQGLVTGTCTSGADNSICSDDIQKNHQSYDSDCVTRATKIRSRENLRRVQAFSPHTSILDIETGLDLESFSARETLRSVQAAMTSDATIEFEKQPDPLHTDDDAHEINVDCYLLEEDITKESQSKESTFADEKAESSTLFRFIEAPKSLEEPLDDHWELKDVDKEAELDKETSNDCSLDFPKEFRKQKRSTTRRRGRPSASINLVRKLKWLSDTEHESMECDQTTQVAANVPVSIEKRTNRTRKTKRKTMPISSLTTLSSEPSAN